MPIVVYRRKSTSIIPPNDTILINGGFETDSPLVLPWSRYTNGDASLSSYGVDARYGDYTGIFNITTVGDNVQINQTGFAINNGVNYRFRYSFKASSTANGIGIHILNNIDPYTNLGYSTTINVTTSWQDWDVNFTATGTTSDARLYITIDNILGDGEWLRLDGFALQVV